MEFITGLLLGICLFEAYIIFHKKKPIKLERISEREKEEQEKREKHLDSLMNYDISVAYGRKK